MTEAVIGLWRRVRDQFWALPLLCALLALGLGLALCRVDDSLDTARTLPFLFGGGPEGARSLLSAIITSMISFTGLVFSITIVVLQLTSSQFSPRVLRTFLQDRFNQMALGIFVATFIYALVVLRAVRGTAEYEPGVPQLAVTVAFGFVVLSVGVFLAYIHHIAQSIRAATITARIGDETRALIDRRHPADAEPRERLALPAEAGTTIAARRPGIVSTVDDDRLLTLAERHGAVVSVVPVVGAFVPTGGALARVLGGEDLDADEVRTAVRLEDERSLHEDVGFGLRQLVDIAERALSPGINDPSTAIQAIDQLHDVLRRLAARPLVPRQRVTEDGRLAVDVPEPGFGGHLDLAVDEIAHWGADSGRVTARLAAMLSDLEAAARPEHRDAVRQKLTRLKSGAPAPGA